MNTTEQSEARPGAEKEGSEASQRCVILIDDSLPSGKAANAAAVMALTMGMRQPHLVGGALVDGAGNAHPGLIPIGLPVLEAPAADFPRLREKALAAGLDVVDFPVEGQQTTDYAEFQRLFAEVDPESVQYLGMMVYGTKKRVSRLVGRYGLLKSTGARDEKTHEA